MKFGLKKRLYNAEVRNRRKALGLTQSELGAKAGISIGTVCAIEGLRVTRTELPCIQKLAEFFSVEPEVLVPKWLRLLNELPKELDAQRDVGQKELEQAAFAMIALPETVPADQVKEVNLGELKRKMNFVLDTLSFREREIIRLRYGIGTGYNYDLEQVGRIFKITRERVRQIEAKALKKMQHPIRSRKLQGYVLDHIDEERKPTAGTQKKAEPEMCECYRCLGLCECWRWVEETGERTGEVCLPCKKHLQDIARAAGMELPQVYVEVKVRAQEQTRHRK